MLFCTKNLERIGDHTTNIAEAVYYMVKGEALLGERPKADLTALATMRKSTPVAAGNEPLRCAYDDLRIKYLSFVKMPDARYAQHRSDAGGRKSKVLLRFRFLKL